VRAPLLVDHDESGRIDLHMGAFETGIFELGRRPTATSTRSKICSFATSLPALLSRFTRMPLASACIFTTVVSSRTLSWSGECVRKNVDEIAIGSRKQARRHLATVTAGLAEMRRGVDRAEFSPM